MRLQLDQMHVDVRVSPVVSDSGARGFPIGVRVASWRQVSENEWTNDELGLRIERDRKVFNDPKAAGEAQHEMYSVYRTADGHTWFVFATSTDGAKVLAEEAAKKQS